jgi:hypothetical protein
VDRGRSSGDGGRWLLVQRVGWEKFPDVIQLLDGKGTVLWTGSPPIRKVKVMGVTLRSPISTGSS